MFRERSDGRRERGRSNDSPQQSGRRSLARKDEDERRRSGAELENLQAIDPRSPQRTRSERHRSPQRSGVGQSPQRTRSERHRSPQRSGAGQIPYINRSERPRSPQRSSSREMQLYPEYPTHAAMPSSNRHGAYALIESPLSSPGDRGMNVTKSFRSPSRSPRGGDRGLQKNQRRRETSRSPQGRRTALAHIDPDSIDITQLPVLESLAKASNEDSDEEWARCWRCDGPVRGHWDECPALGCGAKIAEAATASDVLNAAGTRPAMSQSQQALASPGAYDDRHARVSGDRSNSHLGRGRLDSEEESDSQGTPMRALPRIGDNSLLPRGVVDKTAGALDSMGYEMLEEDSETEGADQGNGGEAGGGGYAQDMRQVKTKELPRNSAGDPYLEREGSDDSVWAEKDALPKRRDLPQPTSPYPIHHLALEKMDPSFCLRLGAGTQEEGRQEEEQQWQLEQQADAFKRQRRASPSDAYDGRPATPTGEAPEMNAFNTEMLGNAGGEALGAVKMPDWMSAQGQEGGGQTGGGKSAKGVGEVEGIQWRVHFNNAEANLEEDKTDRNGAGVLPKTDNAVVTAKYTPLTFLPTNLYMQFSRLANMYFALIAALQLFTPFSPTGRFSTAGPLAIVLLANMARELWEDSARHIDDAEVNRRLAEVIRGGRVEEEMWRNLCVGDIVWVKKGQEVPADMLQLASSHEDGGSYVDTCNLDGETNLKMKDSLKATVLTNTHALVSKLEGHVDYEGPNKRLYTFVGKATIAKVQTPIGNESVLLRGSVLRNTAWIYGLVIYAGKQSKIQLNSKRASQKSSNLEKVANQVLAAVLTFELCLCVTAVVASQLWSSAAENKAMWHLPEPDNVVGIFFVYLILLNNYVPISLYFTMELAKLGQKVLIDSDLDMYHQQSDTPALARTSNLHEELGQIEYIFSDKTGTLTRNEMEFRKCWVNNTSYGFGTTEIGAVAKARRLREGGAEEQTQHDPLAELDADKSIAQYHSDPSIEFDDVRLRKRFEDTAHPDSIHIRDFLRILSVSHTVVPEGDGSKASKVRYQAESPDEGALVLAAKCLGFFFCEKTSKTHIVDVFGKRETFELLNVNKFNSTRKRMSMVVRTPEGKILLMVKGADNVMVERLRSDAKFVPEMTEALKSFANEGLRTLVIAQRYLNESDWRVWDQVHRAAQTALDQREEKLMEAAEMIEKDLQLVGATAIEDKLQIGVPDTIATLALARIRIWVLTGDKRETAENIGFACNLLREEMTRIYLLEGSIEELQRICKEEIKRHHMDPKPKAPREELALLVDGKALLELTKCMEDGEAEESAEAALLDFITLATNCKAVICCRVSPDQKRQVVAMIANYTNPRPMTLSVGDGANDVPMILEASVGVGISGNEGMQAVRSADYAIAQFRFLKVLLLFHGRANYNRVSTIVLYSLYKNCVLVSSMLCYGAYTGWTGTALYDSMMIAGFNVFWSGFGIIVNGTIDRDVSAKAAIAYPQLYIAGQRQEGFNLKMLLLWEGTAFFHTLAAFLLSAMVYDSFSASPDYDDSGLRVFGSMVEQSVVAIVNLRLLIDTHNLTYVSLGVYMLGWLLFILVGLVHSLGFFEFDYTYVHNRLLASITAWLVQLLVVFVAVMPDLVWKYVSRSWYARPEHVVRELDVGYGAGLSAYSTVAEFANGLPAAEVVGKTDAKGGYRKVPSKVV